MNIERTAEVRREGTGESVTTTIRRRETLAADGSKMVTIEKVETRRLTVICGEGEQGGEDAN